MKTVLKENIYELEVEKSRFIAIIRHIDDSEQIKEIIQEIKKRYPKARHYCYATIIDKFQKASDDGEPQGTAGKPMLDLLVKNEMNRVIVVVVRYFGGTLLGASRLLRTYVESALLSLQRAKLYQVCFGKSYQITLDYSYYDSVENYLKSQRVVIENSEFEERITLEVFALEFDVLQFKSRFYTGVEIREIDEKLSYVEIEGDIHGRM